MVKEDDFDSISIEVTSERLVVWTAAGTREVPLPHATRDVAEVLGSAIGEQAPGPIYGPLPQK
jgi:hypothetical protein